MRSLLNLILIILLVRLLFAVMMYFPAIGIAGYVFFILYSGWKMQKLSKKRKDLYSSQNPSGLRGRSSDHFIDVDYTEKEIKD